jgi:sterol desaturase/sphingolipid hydroxylase (fatty acid hydroxylase superfamily)
MSSEFLIRICSFALVFAAMAGWEFLAPRRAWAVGRAPRWTNNLGILIVDVLAVRVLVPTAAVGAALFTAGGGWGLFHLAALPLSLAAVLGFLILDLVIYGQHIVFHKVPVLWRLHRMHHADLDIDVTTGVRFHPFEILISLLIKIATVIAFGIPAVAVLLFEVVLNATAMFNHECVHAGYARPRVAPRRRDARHAPGASFHSAQRDRQQFRLQSAVVGPPVRNLPRRARGRPPRHDHRTADLSQSTRVACGPAPDSAVP